MKTTQKLIVHTAYLISDLHTDLFLERDRAVKSKQSITMLRDSVASATEEIEKLNNEVLDSGYKYAALMDDYDQMTLELLEYIDHLVETRNEHAPEVSKYLKKVIKNLHKIRKSNKFEMKGERVER